MPNNPPQDNQLAPGVRAAGRYVAVAAQDEQGRLVLVRRGGAPAQGIWTLPAGYVEQGETPEQAAIREVREETGLNASLDTIFGEFTGPGYHLIVFTGKVVSGSIAPSDDAVDARFFALDDIPFGQPEAAHIPPEQDWAVKTSEHILKALVQHYRTLSDDSTHP